MSIVVFWMESDDRPAHRGFASSQLTDALKFCEERRREGKRHVCISSELPQSVGQGGVNSVENKRLPDGNVYDFDKSHRGAGPGTGHPRKG
jgi:hypothetical protein